MVSSQLICADCLVAMKDMADDSVDSVVTDCPYGLEFMSKSWDYDVPSVEIWEECFRVLKPGGHLLCFGGSRTYHRVAVNIEDAQFEIRDQLQWLYGSGFPKNHSVSLAMDKAAGAEREVLGKRKPEAKQWDGWGTALKPAHEPIVVARKPIEGTVAENVLEHGTGAINVDGCRITDVFSSTGRYPANVILDEEAGAMLDEQAPSVGNMVSGVRKKDTRGGTGHTLKASKKKGTTTGHFDGLGGASRFFYCAKPSQKEKNGGCEQMPLREGGVKNASGRGYKPRCAKCKRQIHPSKSGSFCQCEEPELVYDPMLRHNNHPTVKPVDLMRYLCRLVTPPEGIVLDPFMGSGTTGIAANLEGFNFIGIDMEEEYVEIARARIAHSGEYVITEDLTMKRIKQPTMEDFT